jgi:hypothetical protein
MSGTETKARPRHQPYEIKHRDDLEWETIRCRRPSDLRRSLQQEGAQADRRGTDRPLASSSGRAHDFSAGVVPYHGTLVTKRQAPQSPSERAI